MLTILLPPSEGKAPGGDGPPWTPTSGRFGEALGDRRSAVADALGDLDGGDARLLGVRGDTLARSQAANRALRGAPTLPAWQRFTGVVWDHLDIASLDARTRRRAMRSVLVVSALGGVNALDDPLPEFRCKLSVSLPELGKLSTWWRPAVTDVLAGALRRRLVVDLLPAEHAAAWDASRCGGRLVRVRFVGRDGRVAGHTAKTAKGLLARALLEADDPAATLDRWRHPELRLELERPSR